MVHNWNSKSYDSLTLPHLRWGESIIASLDLHGDETVLDAGAGTGRDTIALLKLLPEGNVIAVDASSSMLDEINEKATDYTNQLQIICSDLSEPFGIINRCDVIISVAAFHWIIDHKKLFTNLRSTLKNGGVLRADCGGNGNISRVSAAFTEVTGRDSTNGRTWNFANPKMTEELLRESGFNNIQVEIVEDPAIFETRSEYEEFLQTVIFGAHLEQFATDERPEIVRAIADTVGSYVVDYVRLKISAMAA